MSNSLLPINASEFEKALEATLCRSEQIDIPIDRLWNPETCPVEVLPWLAWALSVDNWDSQWPEETKRAFISNSLDVHKHKGTLKAIRDVLDNLNIIAEITEWFENDGEPHTFELLAYVDDNLQEDEVFLNHELYQQLIEAVNNTKPVRSHFSFNIGVSSGSEFGLGNIADAMLYLRCDGEFISNNSFSSNISFAQSATSIQYVRLS